MFNNCCGCHAGKKLNSFTYCDFFDLILFNLPQACVRIGAPHAVVFAGFSPGALADRINDCGARVLITMDGAKRGGKTVDLKKIADEAIKSTPNLTHCFVTGRLSHADNSLTNSIDVNLDSALKSASGSCDPVSVHAENPLYFLYTSGSTGKPKGLIHTTGGYLTHAACVHKHAFKVDEGDVYGCVADIGWTVGHAVAHYGNLLNGGTSLLFESLPNFPDPGRYWAMVERHKLTQFFSAPTAYRIGFEPCYREIETPGEAPLLAKYRY